MKCHNLFSVRKKKKRTLSVICQVLKVKNLVNESLVTKQRAYFTSKKLSI